MLTPDDITLCLEALRTVATGYVVRLSDAERALRALVPVTLTLEPAAGGGWALLREEDPPAELLAIEGMPELLLQLARERAANAHLTKELVAANTRAAALARAGRQALASEPCPALTPMFAAMNQHPIDGDPSWRRE